MVSSPHRFVHDAGLRDSVLKCAVYTIYSIHNTYTLHTTQEAILRFALKPHPQHLAYRFSQSQLLFELRIEITTRSIPMIIKLLSRGILLRSWNHVITALLSNTKSKHLYDKVQTHNLFFDILRAFNNKISISPINYMDENEKVGIILFWIERKKNISNQHETSFFLFTLIIIRVKTTIFQNKLQIK